MDFDIEGKRIWVAGHGGMVGRAVIRRMADERCTVLTVDRRDLDLFDPAATLRWIEDHRPDAIVMAAAKVSGIHANLARPFDHLYENLALAQSVLHGALRAGTRKVVYLGSSCIYPRMAPQPIAEDALLTSALEPTNEGYALAKIVGVKLCQSIRRQYGADFIALMPTNLYGPHDNFDPASSHVIPGMLLRFHDAKRAGARAVTVWGSGTPQREFMHVDDMADALVFCLRRYSGEMHLNIGSGEEVSIGDLARKVAAVVEFDGEIVFDTSMPDGTPRKLLDSGRLSAMGWRPRIGFDEGLRSSYKWYRTAGRSAA